MKKSGLIIGLVILVIVVGALVLGKKSDKATPSTNTTSTQPTQTANNPNNASQTAPQSQGTITYTSNGFDPASLTVTSGSSVTIKNNSSSLLQFDSDPHPEHTDDPELNVGTISPGQSKTITVTKTGSHGYHNHLNPSDTGVLVVQ